LKLYLDASALVKRYVDEIGSDVVGVAMSRADTCSICRVGYVETVRAVARGGEPDDLTRVDRDWMGFHIVEVDRSVTETAAHLGIKAGLRTLDALHLAAALSLAGAEIVFATWDARLHRAAQARGLRTLPAVLG
jgi:predicted nucleic acid-binding protein